MFDHPQRGTPSQSDPVPQSVGSGAEEGGTCTAKGDGLQRLVAAHIERGVPDDHFALLALHHLRAVLERFSTVNNPNHPADASKPSQAVKPDGAARASPGEQSPVLPSITPPARCARRTLRS
jgi:hypothetical protein